MTLENPRIRFLGPLALARSTAKIIHMLVLHTQRETDLVYLFTDGRMSDENNGNKVIAYFLLLKVKVNY